MAAAEALIAAIDRVIAHFNARQMDLPDGFFDRKTQFVINGAPFETLLGTAPDDPLVLMLARGPAGYRFTAKALQHAIPDAKLEPGEVLSDVDPLEVTTKLWLSGTLRGSGEAINAVVDVTLRLSATGSVEIAEAEVDPIELEKIRTARLRT
jgi:hypothetical protein